MHAPPFPLGPLHSYTQWQDGITAFEALESGVLHPLRDLLAWLEESLVGETAVTDAHVSCLTPAVKVAEQLEREAVSALALVPTPGPLSAPAGEGSGETHRVRSEAVLEVGAFVVVRGLNKFIRFFGIFARRNSWKKRAFSRKRLEKEDASRK